MHTVVYKHAMQILTHRKAHARTHGTHTKAHTHKAHRRARAHTHTHTPESDEWVVLQDVRPHHNELMVVVAVS